LKNLIEARRKGDGSRREECFEDGLEERYFVK
jgi:hypothetical protein